MLYGFVALSEGYRVRHGSLLFFSTSFRGLRADASGERDDLALR